jgi:tetratricopeptide (TPR) repeat protein
LLVSTLLSFASFAQAQSAPKVTAYIFTTTDCPIANRYAPEIERLHRQFSNRGVVFRLVYVNPRESEATIREHASKFGYSMSIERDATHTLVKRFGITVTPEAAVVDARGELMYRGRIDDRYTAIGVDRQRATKQDLQDALDAIVNGRRVPTSSVPAVGCFVADLRPVTFSRDIAPIVYDKCASCHRAGGPAPFSLLTYRDVRQRASLVASVTEMRFMPPYRATSGAGSFVGQKQLTSGEIALIRQWVSEGATEGDARDLPSRPKFVEGWQLGKPDVVVTIPTPYRLPAGGTDAFRIFVVPLPVNATRYVTGVEFHPGKARVVHHANIRLDRTTGSRELDQRDPAPGYDGLLARSAVYPDGHFLGWTPGQVAPLVNPNLAWRLEPGTDLVVQLHMQPSGADEEVQPEIGLFFGDAPAVETPTILRLGSQGLDIPAGVADHRVDDAYVLPVDVVLHAVQPHAHYRLRQARGTATLPDGSTRILIDIPDWDFRWQHVYRYQEPIALPKGTRVAMSYRYDNGADNPRNPQVPPQRVRWGQRSFDEMGDLWFQFTTVSATDRAVLSDQILRKMTAEDIVGYETLLSATPDDLELHDDVALLYLSAGRPNDAVSHFNAAVRLQPADPTAHFNLGTALTVAGALEPAMQAFREALRLRPSYAAAMNNLGSVLAATGRVDEAISEFRAATRADASNVQAHRNLAWHITRRSAVTPSLAAEAVRAAEKAASLSNDRDPNVLDVLAAAYAAAGMPDKAAIASARARRLRDGR